MGTSLFATPVDERPDTRVYWRRGCILSQSQRLVANAKARADVSPNSLSSVSSQRGFNVGDACRIMWDSAFGACHLSAGIRLGPFQLEGRKVRADVFGFPASLLHVRASLAGYVAALDFTAIFIADAPCNPPRLNDAVPCGPTVLLDFVLTLT